MPLPAVLRCRRPRDLITANAALPQLVRNINDAVIPNGSSRASSARSTARFFSPEGCRERC